MHVSLVLLSRDAVLVTERGRLLVRNVAMAFDVYIHQCRSAHDRPVYSKTV